MIKKFFLSAFVALCVIASVNAQIVIEAESYVMTSGTYGGFQKYQIASASGGSAINYNQTGDYAMYQLNNYPSGQYVITYYISTPMTGAAVEFSVVSPTYQESVVTQVPSNGSWDSFHEVVSEPINVISGDVFSFKIASVGNTTGHWEWNLDKIKLTKVGELNFPLESIYTASENPITIDKDEVLYIEVGTQPAIATNQNMTWVSSDTNVVKVPALGYIKTIGGGSTPIIPVGKVENYITGVAEGTATITVTSQEGGFVTSFNVTVIKPHTVIIEAEDVTNPYTLGMPISYGGGTAVQIANGISKPVSFLYFPPNYYTSYNRFAGNSGEYITEYLVKTENVGSILNIELMQTGTFEQLPVYTCELPNTNGEYIWVQGPKINFEYGRNASSMVFSASSPNNIVCNLDKIRFTKIAPLNTPAEGLIFGSDSIISLEPDQWQMGVKVEFTPHFTANQNVTWVSSNTEVVEVASVGTILTYGGGPSPVTQTGIVENHFHAISEGTAIVTATSEDGNYSVSFNVTVGNPTIYAPIIFEAENFSYTAGTYSGFNIYQVGSASNGAAINWNQTGDWATYALPQGMQSGVYEVEYFISTPMNGAQIGFAVDYGDLDMVDNVLNNGSWDNFVSLKAANTIEIDGSYNGSVQVKSVGAAGAWQWNLDYFTLTKVAELPAAKSGKLSLNENKHDFIVYPTIVDADLTVEFELVAEGAVVIDIVNVNGTVVANVVNGEVFFEGSNSVTYNASALASGIYFVRLISDNNVKVERIVK